MNKIRVEICKCLTQGSNSIPLETQARRSCSLISNAGGSVASYIYKGENRRNFYLSFSGSPESVWLLTGRGNTCISSALYYYTELDIVSYLVDYNKVQTRHFLSRSLRNSQKFQSLSKVSAPSLSNLIVIRAEKTQPAATECGSCLHCSIIDPSLTCQIFIEKSLLARV
ncbi:unnamed protein product [Arctogadus glacialis]